jgi:hypothetical protein
MISWMILHLGGVPKASGETPGRTVVGIDRVMGPSNETRAAQSLPQLWETPPVIFVRPL